MLLAFLLALSLFSEAAAAKDDDKSGLINLSSGNVEYSSHLGPSSYSLEAGNGAPMSHFHANSRTRRNHHRRRRRRRRRQWPQRDQATNAGSFSFSRTASATPTPFSLYHSFSRTTEAPRSSNQLLMASDDVDDALGHHDEVIALFVFFAK